MERSSNTPAQAQNQAPARRDMMFCHVCADEWYRDEHGLACPECGSDFTEIIEENNDPRDSAMFADGDGDDDSMPDLEEAPPHRNPHHDPFASDDPDEGDISNLQFIQTAPGRYNVQATFTRSVSPQQFRAAGGMAPASIGGFMSMLNGLTRAAAGGQAGPQQRGQGEGLFAASNQNQNQSAFHEARGQDAEGQPRITASRFTYSGGARLFPRDANNPEPRMEPVDDITNVVTGLMAALGAPPGSLHAQQHRAGGAEAQFHGDHTHDHDHPGHVHPAHPFLQLFSSLGMVGPGGNMGDFVYSQEGLDRIVSQLMEQTASSNAPGPAPQSDIDNLPRKKVDEEMLGAEQKAECSICMDEVNIGEEVTVLPCHHWFHHACVSAWLQEHDTCPHCRKGISKDHADQSSSPSAGGQAGSGAQASGSRQMPGAFDASGSGTVQDPYVVPGDAGSAQAGSSANAGSGANSGGISDRIRRGLFGPQQ